MGVLAPGSAHVRPSAQPPIDMSGNFPAHVSAVTFKIFKKNLKKPTNRLQGGAGQFLFFFKVTLQTRTPKNFRSRRWGAERRVSRAQTRERGPPSA